MRKSFWFFLVEFLGWFAIAQSLDDEKYILLLGGFKGEDDPQKKVLIYNKEDGRTLNCLNYANDHIVEGSLGAILMGLDDEERILVTCGGKGPDNAGKCFQLNGGIAHHCALNINSNTTMIIGGEIQNQISPRTFIYDWKFETWRSGPELNIGRKFHSCGLHLGKVIITGGENEEGKALNVTEIFDPVLNKIFFGPRLNHSITKAAMVSLNSNELYLIGGHLTQAVDIIVPQKHIIQYKDSGKWIKVGELSVPMYLHTAHGVPESFWYNCQSSASIIIALNSFYLICMVNAFL
ncbi:uncharacterized protein [Lepeophtheirus salmonis]|uniref:uncharacterized protein isoform X2 n=1 Tax=Lepeophtheirus salmonis TaxID=72036 RepID=UPI001AEB7CC7|nr:uncharacterized protein LOC121121349 isoform X2 [Lepeophtheirus salmonis]